VFYDKIQVRILRLDWQAHIYAAGYKAMPAVQGNKGEEDKRQRVEFISTKTNYSYETEKA
jgi:hypothetical protein